MIVDRVILITGPMRSGTSLVAQVVHRLGWQVAPLISAPMPPTWRSDWEDTALTVRLMRGERPDRQWWRRYVARRRAASMMLGFGGRIAIKSPYLALVWEDVVKACPERVVIRTFRDPVDTARSMRAHPMLKQEDQQRIQSALAQIRPFVVFDYACALAVPEEYVAGLARELGVQDDAAVAAAAATIGAPTLYRC